ncbi:rhodocetin subunit gamma-like precursor [Callorhinchus milii]|nr:rhodocetin subunit gamma-like precursor [Callorhinchus milii]AFK11039.1 c-type lectin BFL-2-like protein [Callorhinchus milii]AFM87056.1 c-type lectin BFL-2-like protein [Callorhinchus milii]AFM87101.1 c-type lectin BFL-2-like protein [Callorhinchus milii]AFM87187.1 c-type lectin BFL-2-like protein [Callorhinchus milii]AFM87263.1 c-type lectin BFL-2-like protein [Callorhinchus milii]
MMLGMAPLLSALLFCDAAALDEENKMMDVTKKFKCANKWIQSPSGTHCFRYFNEPLTWLSAETTCKRMERTSHLASIHNNEQNAFLAKMVNGLKSKTKQFWIGLKDRKEEKYTWSDKTNYAFGKLPTTSSSPENRVVCVTFILLSSEWKHMACKTKLPFICSYKPTK